MAIAYKDRVRDTTQTTGTGTITLDGSPPTGFQGFSAFTTGDTVEYVIESADKSEWEIGSGVYTSSGTTLSRASIFASSNAGSAVNFSAGTKAVFATVAAQSIRKQNIKQAPLGDLVTGVSGLTNLATSTKSNAAMTANVLYKCALNIVEPFTATKLGVILGAAGAAGKKLRIGMRTMTLQPSGLYTFGAAPIVESADLTADGSVGARQVTFSSTVFQPGLYCCEAVSDGAPTLVGGLVVGTPFGGVNSTSFSAIVSVSRSYTFTAGSSSLPTNEDTLSTSSLTPIVNGTAAIGFLLLP